MRTRQYRLRLTDDEYYDLKKLSEEKGLPMSELLRLGLFLLLRDEVIK